MSDALDLGRLICDRVRSAGLVVRRVTWTPGHEVRVSFATADDQGGMSVYFDEDLGPALRPNGGTAVIDIIDAEIARAMRAMRAHGTETSAMTETP